MKIVLLLALLVQCTSAQEESSGFERATYVLGASAVYVAYDYFVFAPNQWREGTAAERWYRVSQVALLGVLAWYLVDKFGWKTGAAFGSLYLSWNFDAAYYWMCGRGVWNAEVEGGTVTWARHTPVAWFNPNPISAKALKIQMGVGMVLSVALLL